MRHRLFFPGHRILRAAASGVVMVAAAAAGLGAPLAGSLRPVSLAASAAAARPAGPVTVPLVTGDRVTVTTTGAGRSSYVLRPSVAGGGVAALAQESGGDHYVIPAAAVPYAGRQLDRSLFDVSALARDGITGSARVPVSLAFAAGVTPTAPPGVTLTSVSGQQAQGYLTAGSTPAFAAALRRQIGADVAAGRQPGTAPLFGGLAAMDLAAAGPPVTAQPYYPLHILQLNVTDGTGSPATFETVALLNNDDHLAEEQSAVPAVGGVARIAVPAGNYTASVTFEDFDSSGNTTAWHVVTLDNLVVPDTANVTTAAIDERSATSAVSATTPRPASQDILSLLYYSVDAKGSDNLFGLLTSGPPNAPVYVNAQAPAAVGRLDYLVQWGGAAPAASAAYRYDVAFKNAGVPADERFVVQPGQVATVRQHIFADPGITGKGWSLSSGPVDADSMQQAFPQITSGLDTVTAPLTLTDYMGTADGGEWAQDAWLYAPMFALGYSADPRMFAAGHRYSEQWGHGPLAPEFGLHNGGQFMYCLACMAGNTLTLDMFPLGDSEPDHAGLPGGILYGYHLTTYRDGTQIYDSDVDLTPNFGVVPGVPATAATFRVVLDTDLTAVPGMSQSTRTHTDVTVPYSGVADPGAALPADDFCYGQSASTPCQILPGLTLNYRLATDQLNTSSAPVQVLRLGAGHISYDGAGSHAAITSATVSVSFDGGATWHPATMTGSAGKYTATWPNPASARGTDPEIKVTAADAIGGSITQTITNAYTIAAAG